MYMFTLPSNVNDLPADVAAPTPGKSFTWTLFFMFIHHGNATIYGHPTPPTPLYINDGVIGGALSHWLSMT